MNKIEIKNILLTTISMWKNEDLSEEWTDYEMIGLDKLEILYKCFDFDPEWNDCVRAHRRDQTQSKPYEAANTWFDIMTDEPNVFKDNHIIQRDHIESSNGDLSQLECNHCGEDFDTTLLKQKHIKSRKCEFYRTCSFCKETLHSKFNYDRHTEKGCVNKSIVEKAQQST